MLWVDSPPVTRTATAPTDPRPPDACDGSHRETASHACDQALCPRKQGREPFWSKSWLSVRHVERFVLEKAGLCQGNGIDYGCGNMPYASWLRPHAESLLGVDVAQSSEGVVDVVIEAGEALPFEDGSLDFVTCTQVLEHVQDPHWHLAEMSRVLKVGGVILLTLPFVWEQHEIPHDYYRFTEFGVRHLASENDLRVAELEPGGGMIECVAQIAVFRLPSFRFLDPIVYGPVNLLAALLDRLFRMDRITCNWHCVLRKI
jgi:SAM-dependent methyltransferase